MKNIYYLIKQEFFDQKKRVLVLGAVIFLISFISRFTQEFFNRFGNTHTYNYQDGIGGYLYVAGFIFTSLCFARSMHSKRGQHAWLMLPVYAHEKLIVKIISYSITYPLGLILFTFISSLVNEGIMWVIWRHSVPLFNPFDPMIWEMAGHYVVISSLFMLGASYFRSAHFIKTILSVLAFAVSLAIIAGVSARIAYAPHFDLMTSGNFQIEGNLILAQINYERWAEWGERLGKILFWGVLAPLFWTLSYFRIREIEAKDAV